MEAKPPKKEALPSRAQSGELQDNQNLKDHLGLLDKPLCGYLKFTKGECERLNAGPISRQFLQEAESRYLQFCRTGDQDLRRLFGRRFN